MTISERLQLHKLGYTKEEIKALADGETSVQDNTPAQNPESKPASSTGGGSSDILTAINNLTAAIQSRNVTTSEQKETKIESAEDVLVGALKNL